MTLDNRLDATAAGVNNVVVSLREPAELTQRARFATRKVGSSMELDPSLAKLGCMEHAVNHANRMQQNFCL